MMPFDIIDVLYEHHVKFQPPACHDCPIGGHDQPGGPTCHNFDACQLECERDMEAVREDQADDLTSKKRFATTHI